LGIRHVVSHFAGTAHVIDPPNQIDNRGSQAPHRPVPKDRPQVDLMSHA
jgi:hypothetical protein